VRGFNHQGIGWEAERSGGGKGGVGSGHPPPAASWGVWFRRVSDGKLFRGGRTRHRDLTDATEDELRASLDAAIAGNEPVR